MFPLRSPRLAGALWAVLAVQSLFAPRLTARVTPRAGRNALDGVTADGAVRVRLAAPPVDGAANAALVAFLAGLLGLPKRAVTITGGQTSRTKRVHIAASPAVVKASLGVVQ